MQGNLDGLWGPTKARDVETSSLSFEDSFSPPCSELETDSPDSRNAEKYVPLQDSPQYLAGLEGKLARLRGRTESSRKTESRRLLDALAGSRSCHIAQLMQDTNTPTLPAADQSDPTPSSLASTIDPQGALGAMLRRVVPDRVALTPEELCHLLQSDLLAQMHESELEGAAPCETAITSNIKGQDAALTHSSGALDTREPSSDEGEK